jgi:type I restriction enzyme S subunit
LEKFELIAETPGAITKIRELVRRLAIRGKLVERYANDGNATTIFAGHPPPPSQVRYEVSRNWVWVPFSSVGEQRLGKMLDQKGNQGELKPYLRNTNVQWMRFELDDIKKLRLEVNELKEYRLLPGDLLICEGGEPGRCAIWKDRNQEMYFQKAIHRVRPRKGILAEYLAVCLKADAESGVLTEYFTGATIKHFTGRSLREYSIPLPPLAEQKRIVAKVEELMALCDRLEAQQKERETRHTVLARASLSCFADAPTPANLTFLFHKSYIIAPADLRKSILTLAVRGKLVPQDPNDEADVSSIPLKLGQSESSRGSQLGPFELRSNWRWALLGQVSTLINGDRSKNYPNKVEYVQEGVPWINTGHIERDGTLSLDSMHYITRKKFDSLRGGKVRSSDLVYCLRGATLGKTAIITQFEEGAVASSLVIIRPSSALDSKFAYQFLTSPLGRGQISTFDNGSAQPNLSAHNVKKYWIPIPPLAEQRRIVAKVDQLMALVDELESQLAASRATAAKLLDAIVGELTA